MTPTREEVSALVREAVVEIYTSIRDEATAPALAEETRLIGREALFDSMGLVTLVVEVEQLLESRYDIVLMLADERAMSMTRSPFASVGSLTEYVMQRIEQDSA